jgi:hypothetical protein
MHTLLEAARNVMDVVAAAGLNKPTMMYLDPGSGSFIIQLLIGAGAGILVTVGVFWDRIKAFFGRSSGAELDEDEDDELEDV